MADEAAAPELPHYVNCFLEHLAANICRRPALPDDVLVEILTGADAEKEAALEQARSRRRRLGDDGRMDTDRWTRNARPNSKLACAGCNRPEYRPDKRALALRVNPGVKVIGDQSKRKPGLFSSDRVSDQVRRTVLFARERVTDLHQRVGTRRAGVSKPVASSLGGNHGELEKADQDVDEDGECD